MYKDLDTRITALHDVLHNDTKMVPVIRATMVGALHIIKGILGGEAPLEFCLEQFELIEREVYGLDQGTSEIPDTGLSERS